MLTSLAVLPANEFTYHQRQGLVPQVNLQSGLEVAAEMQTDNTIAEIFGTYVGRAPSDKSVCRDIWPGLPDGDAGADCAVEEEDGEFRARQAHFHGVGPGQPSPICLPQTVGLAGCTCRLLPRCGRKNLMCKVMDTRANIATYFSSRKYQLSSSSVVGEKYFVSLTVPFPTENAAEFPVKRSL